ncbi:MAG: hypothetical protein QG629_891 [Patescibacteria group bacterium]|nr:hypothetical protein [Candidatus Saccharibacteria bacterium]MDQ5963808.1 hypothetical protein [Patescibacteria group bacterium]
MKSLRCYIEDIKKRVLALSITVGMGVALLLAPSALAFPVGNNGPNATPGASTGGVQSEVCDGIGGCDTGGTGRNAGLNKTLNFVINLLLVLLGVISVIMIIVGGIKYSASGGDSNATASAKNTIIYALIGLAIAAAAKPLVGLILKSI